MRKSVVFPSGVSAVFVFDFHKAFQSGFVKINTCPYGFLDVYIFNTVNLFYLFYKLFVKLRHFFIELLILVKLNIGVFKIIIKIRFDIISDFILPIIPLTPKIMVMPINRDMNTRSARFLSRNTLWYAIT